MSEAVVKILSDKLGAKVIATSAFRGDHEVIVERSAWLEAATLLRDDAELAFDHFIDFTAVDYPEREPETPRFDVVLHMRSSAKNHRIRLKTRVRDGEEVDSLSSVWRGANWTEREVFDLFGVRFRNHPDLRRIMMYDEFVGHPLRKDYPIDKTQPLVQYRDVTGTEKIAPFRADEGQPWGRIDWQERLAGRDLQTTPALQLQTGQREALSQGSETLPEPTVSPTKGPAALGQ